MIGLATGKSGDQVGGHGGAGAAPVPGRRHERELPRVRARGHRLAGPHEPRPAGQALGLTADEGGIRLTRVLPHGSGVDVLKPGDVVLAIAGHPLDPPASSTIRSTVAWRFPCSSRTADARVTCCLSGSPARRPAPERQGDPPADAGRRRARPPVRLRPRARLRGDGRARLPGDVRAVHVDLGRGRTPRAATPAHRQRPGGSEPTPERPRIVLLTSVLPDAANLGYQDLRDMIVDKVNGQPIGSMDDLAPGVRGAGRRVPRAGIPGRHIAGTDRARCRGGARGRRAHPHRLRSAPDAWRREPSGR